MLVGALKGTRPVELGCEECFDELDVFAREHLAGRNPAEARPLIAEHLERCGCCQEEFEFLMEALAALEEPPSLRQKVLSRLRRQA